MSGSRSKKIRKELNRALMGKVREVWASLASLPLKERVKLAFWMLKGKTELPKGNG